MDTGVRETGAEETTARGEAKESQGEEGGDWGGNGGIECL